LREFKRKQEIRKSVPKKTENSVDRRLFVMYTDTCAPKGCLNHKNTYQEEIDMSTTLVKPAEVERKWYLLDAAGKSLGHVAAEAAVLLRGKQKVDYTPNVDCGDFVVVINCDKAVLTGKKAEQKFHITHSKFIGGLKKTQYSKLMAENSDLAMTYAVKGMIPSNTIGAKALTRLHCYQGAEHAHAAQKPEKIEF